MGVLHCQGEYQNLIARRLHLPSTHRGGLGRVFAPELKSGRRGLDREQIMQAALALLDEVGLAGLTMRRLAERLDVKAASLYWHVQDKDDLLELLADAITAEIQPPAPGLPWRAAVEQLAWECRRVYLAHRDAAAVLTETIPLGPNRIRLIEVSFASLLAAGFTPQETVYAGMLVNEFITHSVMEERHADAAAANAASDDLDLLTEFDRYLKNLPPATYPSIISLAPYMSESDPEPRFRFGLATILDGLELRLNVAQRERNL